MTTGASGSGKILVVFFALLYWAGVLVNAYRIKKHTGRSPNMRPSGAKERLLWAGWFFVIAGWVGQPLVIEKLKDQPLFAFVAPLFHPAGLFLGAFLALCGYAGTIWCYSAIGDSWRIGINRRERTALVTHGPYRFIRHPIYSFQIVILAGVFLILPNMFSLLLLVVHFICVLVKALDEEAYLFRAHAFTYKEYFSRTGRFFPRVKGP